MEDKHQLLNHGKPQGENEQGIVRGLSCSPDHPITRPPDLFTRPPDHLIGSPEDPICSCDHAITRSPDSEHCRECLAAMAHRLAQPMTALRGGIELALMGKRSAADYRTLFEQSLQLADNMAQLVVSMRDLGESSAPGGPPQSVLLEATVTEVVAEMEDLAELRKLRLQLRVEGTVRVCVDPQRLREALQSLLAWIIQNSAGGGVIALELSASEGEARVFLAPPRLDLQYLQIKILEEFTNPGMLFSHATKNGALGWAINQRLLDGLGGKLEILTDGPDAGCIRVRFPLAPQSEVANPS
jgi:K+-sensing histidine kinase KdpD